MCSYGSLSGTKSISERALGLRKTRAVPKAVAFALPAVLITTIPLSVIGGPLVTGAFWIAVGSRSLHAAEPVVATSAA
jgi:hypothetical protein